MRGGSGLKLLQSVSILGLMTEQSGGCKPDIEMNILIRGSVIFFGPFFRASNRAVEENGDVVAGTAFCRGDCVGRRAFGVANFADASDRNAGRRIDVFITKMCGRAMQLMEKGLRMRELQKFVMRQELCENRMSGAHVMGMHYRLGKSNHFVVSKGDGKP